MKATNVQTRTVWAGTQAKQDCIAQGHSAGACGRDRRGIGTLADLLQNMVCRTPIRHGRSQLPASRDISTSLYVKAMMRMSAMQIGHTSDVDSYRRTSNIDHK